MAAALAYIQDNNLTDYEQLAKDVYKRQALTQNVKDFLASPEIENIFENSDFLVLLSQAQGDRQILAKQLGISPLPVSYTHLDVYKRQDEYLQYRAGGL